MTLFFGKYRGQVQNNVDTDLSGRLQVTAPAVLGNAIVWALPCTPFAGPGVGLYLIPPVGANVWVEFEGGDPEKPIWSGCFWALGDLPQTMAMPQMKVLKTSTATVTLSDLPGVDTIKIETADGNKITVGPTSIQIDNGKGGTVTLQGPKVSINGSALEVI
jgi:uncharacterized protein involved in type VI secretion and phage assembly